MTPCLVVTFKRTPGHKGARCQMGRGYYPNKRPWPFDTAFVDVAMPWNHRTENDALKVAGDYVSSGEAENATVWWRGDEWREVARIDAALSPPSIDAGGATRE